MRLQIDITNETLLGLALTVTVTVLLHMLGL